MKKVFSFKIKVLLLVRVSVAEMFGLFFLPNRHVLIDYRCTRPFYRKAFLRRIWGFLGILFNRKPMNYQAGRSGGGVRTGRSPYNRSHIRYKWKYKEMLFCNVMFKN